MNNRDHDQPDQNPSPTTVQLTARVETPYGPLTGKLTVNTGPTRLAELVPSILAFAEGLIGLALREERKQGREISCRQGCTACCHYLIPLSVPEVFYLSDLLTPWPPNQQREVAGRFTNIVGQLQSRGLSTQMLNPDNTNEQNFQLGKEYFQLGLPCPLLSDGSCLIYQGRPIACREYHVTTPAEWCSTPAENPVRSVKLPVAIPVVLARLCAELLDRPAQLIPLSCSMHWAQQNDEINQRTWPGRWLFEKFLACFNAHGPSDQPTTPAEE